MTPHPDELSIYEGPGSYKHDPMHIERPREGHPVGYYDVNPGTFNPMATHHWHKLGEAHKPADQLMHGYFLDTMVQLALSPHFLAARVFYPDEEGMMMVCALIEVKGRPVPLMLWMGFNARAAYVSAALALAAMPEALTPEGLRGRRLPGNTIEPPRRDVAGEIAEHIRGVLGRPT